MSEIWVIKDNAPIGLDTFDSADLNFRSNGQRFVRIQIFSNANYNPGTEETRISWALRYFVTKSSSDYVQVTSPTLVSVNDTPTGNTWSFTDEAYRTIVFDTAPTGKLLAWLQKNADNRTEYLTSASELTSVANAIRAKGGTSASLVYPDGFVTAIQAILLGIAPQLIVTVSAGATITATNGSKTIIGTSDSTGVCTLTVPEAGTWSVSATLDGQTSDTKTVSITDTYMVSLTFFSATITVTVDSGASVSLQKDGTTIQTKTSTGTVVFTVTETGTYTIVATKNGQTTSGSVNVVSSTTSYALTLSFVSATLNDNEWDVIKSVSDAGQGANYWSIGDRKEVTLNGTVGHLSLSNYTTYAFIIGFNHNASVEGANHIHFQLAKTALSSGTDVCFYDNKYSPDSLWTSVSTTGYFSMNASATNSGGWKSSQMRTTICGTSLSSYSGTIIAVIPDSLRAVLKSVTKYTDNTGESDGSESSFVTATTDYFFLLSEFEVFGSITSGNTNEANKQAQYAYYSTGNSKIKYKYNSTSNAAWWWLRSPRVGATYNYRFLVVSPNGGSGNNEPNYSLGFAPGFCV